MGILLPGLNGGRTSTPRTLDDVVADAFGALAVAAIGVPWLSDNPDVAIVATKGIAGSTAYAYRNRLVLRGLPARGASRQVEELREFLTGNGIPVPDVLANAPGKSWAWLLTRADSVTAKIDGGTVTADADTLAATLAAIAAEEKAQTKRAAKAQAK